MAFRKRGKKAPEPFRFSQEGSSQEGSVGTMRMADDMRITAQEIMKSFETRVAGVAALRQETGAKLKGFRQEMKNVRHELGRRAADLKRFLGNAAASRMRDFRAMHQGIRAAQEARSRQVGEMLSACRGMLSGFRREHEAAASHWQTMAATMVRMRASATR